ncbi:MAG: 30S ribosomal protein S8 [bacterium]|nr:30S ribosomal protein S8 [bacterium]
MVTDPIADLIARLRNAGQAGHASAVLPFSKIKFEIANALVRAGYLKDVSVVEKTSESGKKTAFKYLDLTISYSSPADRSGKKTPKIVDAWRVSKVSRRIYSGIKSLKPARQGFGATILSTTKGILTDKEARKAKLGGEVLLTVW